MVDVELVAGMGGLNPKENLGASSTGLGGSETEFVVVVAGVGGLKAKDGFVALGAGAGLNPKFGFVVF